MLKQYFIFFYLSFFLIPFSSVMAQPQHGLAMHGQVKYPADFLHLDYVNPQALKGGILKMAAIGSFDNLNPYILKGIPAAGASMVYETLTVKTDDEAFSEYGLIAETIETSPDRSWVAFTLRPQAIWHDGQPITVDDVVWTFNTLREKGHPFYRSYYGAVDRVEKTDSKTVKFIFKSNDNKELPLIIGQMPVLPKHYWEAEGRDFSQTTTQPPLGSGPYKIAKVETGRAITYERVADWWGKDLPINVGKYNFDTIQYDYYRDVGVALQALLGGQYDIRQENVAKQWALSYDHPSVKSGKLLKQTIEHNIPTGMQAFVYNLRRPLFQDAKVREALAHAFDFEWANKQFAFDSYTRTKSYFSNSELASTGLPSEAELALLEPYRNQLPADIFEKEYLPPKTDGSGSNRTNLRRAKQLFEQAGWSIRNGVLVDKQDKPFEFEFLLSSPMFERWIQPFIANLKKLGVQASIRVVDTAQYQNRLDQFDYDIVVSVFGQSLSPGNEQFDYWGSESANTPGTRNVAGIQNPVIDALIKKIVAADSREDLVTATRALDRVLLWNHYVIPQWHINAFRLAYWDKFGRPAVNPPYALPVEETWWVKETIEENAQQEDLETQTSDQN